MYLCPNFAVITLLFKYFNESIQPHNTQERQGVFHWSTLFSKWILSEFRFLYGHDEYSLEIQIVLFSYFLAALSKILWQKCVPFLSYRTVSKFVVNKAVKAIAKVVHSIVLHTLHWHAVDPELYGFWNLPWTWNTHGEHVLQNILTNCYNITAVSDFCFTSCCDLMSCKEHHLTCSIVDHLHRWWCLQWVPTMNSVWWNTSKISTVTLLFCLTVVNQEPPAHCNKQKLDMIIKDGHKKWCLEKLQCGLQLDTIFQTQDMKNR